MRAEDQDIRAYRQRALIIFMTWVLPSAPIAAYLNGMTMGVAGWEGVKAVARVLPPIVVGLGVLYPAVVMHVLVGRALRVRPGDAPGARLERILRLPLRAAVSSSWVAWTLGGFWFSLHVCLMWHKSLFLVGVGTLIGVCCGVVLGFPIGVSLERALLPVALAERSRAPTLALRGGGFSWPRQAWFLPFTFVASILSALLLSGCVVMMKLIGARNALRSEMLAEGAERSVRKLMGLEASFALQLVLSLAWVGGLLMLPALTTWMLARRQKEAARAVGASIESLAVGRVTPPQWVSTDEMGDLAAGVNTVLVALQRLPQTLHASATRLSDAGRHLREANDAQLQGIARQASALSEAQATTEEIQRTSMMAANRAQAVLDVARRAEELGRRGETAVEDSLAGLADIRDAVDGIQRRLERLAESTTQIGNITLTVKDLADRSHLLAINAAIEAARSGEHGRGFAVVAREIRGLSDQSIQSTRLIRGILQDIAQGIRDAALMGERGAETILTGLDQMKASGDSLRELSRISQESSAAARHIANSVTQQNAGFAQVSGAISELSETMGDTLKRLEATQDATGTLDSVSREVGEMAERFNASA